MALRGLAGGTERLMRCRGHTQVNAVHHCISSRQQKWSEENVRKRAIIIRNVWAWNGWKRGIATENERGDGGGEKTMRRHWRRSRSSAAAADDRDMMTGGGAAAGGGGGGGLGFGKVNAATAKAMVPINKKENAGMFVDTLALMKRFMRGGLSENQAEEVTLGVQHVLRDAMDCYMERFVNNEGFERVMSDCETRHEYEIMSVRRENDRLRNELEKLRAELKHEVDKIGSSNRLDINLEKGRMREEISAMVRQFTTRTHAHTHTHTHIRMYVQKRESKDAIGCSALEEQVVEEEEGCRMND